MRSKLSALRPSEADLQKYAQVTIRTFHAFCFAALREHGKVSRSVTVYDSHDAKRLIKEVLSTLDSSEPRAVDAAEVKRIFTFISNCKTKMQKPCEFLRGSLERRAWERYESKKEDNGAIDFNDMLSKFVELAKGSSSVQQRLRTRFPFVLVDEFQDTNALQLEITRLLSSNISIVG
jgi:DNA helicase-2/ATP-dependent DNA helicase PcrA